MNLKISIKQKLALILAIAVSAICLTWLATSVINNAFAEEEQDNQIPQTETQMPEITSPNADQQSDGTTTITVNFDTSLFSMYVWHSTRNPWSVETFNLDAPYQLNISGYDHLVIAGDTTDGIVSIYCYLNANQDNPQPFIPDATYQLSAFESNLKYDFDYWEGVPTAGQSFTDDQTFTLHTKDYTGTYSVCGSVYDLAKDQYAPEGTPITYRSADGSYTKTENTDNEGYVEFNNLSAGQAIGFLEYNSNDTYSMLSQVIPKDYDFATHSAEATTYYGAANRFIDGDEGVQNFNYALSLFFNPPTEVNKQGEWEYTFDTMTVYDNLYDYPYLYHGTFEFFGNCQVEDNGNIKVYYRDGEESVLSANVLYATLSFNTEEGKGFDYWEINGTTYRAGETFTIGEGEILNAILHTKDVQPGPQPGPEPTPTPTEEVNAAQTGDSCEAVLPLAILAVLAAGVMLYSRKRVMHK